MKNIHWIGHKETNNTTLYYRISGQDIWLSYIFHNDLEKPYPIWGGWYPNESKFIQIITKDKLPEGWYRVKNPGRFAIAYINAIFEDIDFRLRIHKDFKFER